MCSCELNYAFPTPQLLILFVQEKLSSFVQFYNSNKDFVDGVGKCTLSETVGGLQMVLYKCFVLLVSMWEAQLTITTVVGGFQMVPNDSYFVHVGERIGRCTCYKLKERTEG